MSGIAGFINRQENKDLIVKKMTDRILHRGPDGENYYIDENIALGCRLLSVSNSNENELIFNEEKSKIVFSDSRIYNYQELKDELINLGHTFSFDSEDEILIHGFEEWGEELPNHLRGMFAFVIWDIKNQRLFGARDHFGMKPFYYASFNDTFMFASEIKSFLEHPDFKKELNKDLVAPYLSFNYNPDEETFFKGVKRLNPGHIFLYEDSKLEIKEYYHPTFEEENKEFDKIVEEIANAMEESTAIHTKSNIEIASFLSSGIDSSYITSLVKPQKTYTIGYELPKYSEINHAKKLSDILNIENITSTITKDEYLNIIPKIMYHMDEPLADPSAVALYFASKRAAQDVKIILSGEGADEFFLGYNYYSEEVRYQGYNKIPFFIRKLISIFFSLLPEWKGVNFFVRRGMKLEDYYIGVNWIFREKEVKKYLKDNPQRKLKEYTKDIYEEQKGKSNLIKMQAVDLNQWFVKDILQTSDRMTAANSIEGRLPFTDIKVFEIARNLPSYAKVSKENTKIALRQAAKRVIPNESYNNKKLGFPVPLREWMKEEDYYNQIKEAFETNIAKEIFNIKEILKLLEEHRTNKKDNFTKIWTIYCFIIWHQEFFGN